MTVLPTFQPASLDAALLLGATLLTPEVKVKLTSEMLFFAPNLLSGPPWHSVFCAVLFERLALHIAF